MPKKLDSFLQPRAMVTPGVFGTVAMVGTNALGTVFNFSTHDWGYFATGLVLSFLFGLAVLVKSDSILEKFLYYCANSFIIYSVAFGTNAMGQQALEQHAFLQSSSAYAASITPSNVTSSNLAPQKVQFFKRWIPPHSKTSTICLFTSGPRAKQWQDLHSPMTIGAPCDDGHGSSGTVISAPPSDRR